MLDCLVYMAIHSGDSVWPPSEKLSSCGIRVYTVLRVSRECASETRERKLTHLDPVLFAALPKDEDKLQVKYVSLVKR